MEVPVSKELVRLDSLGEDTLNNHLLATFSFCQCKCFYCLAFTTGCRSGHNHLKQETDHPITFSECILLNTEKLFGRQLDCRIEDKGKVFG